MTHCPFLVHDVFDKQLSDFLETLAEFWGDLFEAMRRSALDPGARGRLGGVANPALQGSIYKEHVGGRDYYRYIYIYLPSKPVVLPAFVSMVLKKDFNYDSEPWEEIGSAIAADLDSGKESKFKKMQFL